MNRESRSAVFLFPAYIDRCGDSGRIHVFQEDARRPHGEILDILGIGDGRSHTSLHEKSGRGLHG